MLAALRRDGVRVTTVVLRDRRDAVRLADLRAPLVLVDTIAASLAAPHLARLRARGSEVVALAHMAQGATALAHRADRVIAVGKALAEWIRGWSKTDEQWMAMKAAKHGVVLGGDTERLLAELDELKRRVAEAEERLDFTERLLAKERDAHGLAPPR